MLVAPLPGHQMALTNLVELFHEAAGRVIRVQGQTMLQITEHAWWRQAVSSHLAKPSMVVQNDLPAMGINLLRLGRWIHDEFTDFTT